MNANTAAFNPPKDPSVVDLQHSDSSDDDSIGITPSKPTKDYVTRRKEAAERAMKEAESSSDETTSSTSSMKAPNFDDLESIEEDVFGSTSKAKGADQTPSAPSAVPKTTS
jgi:hypothetical protein